MSYKLVDECELANAVSYELTDVVLWEHVVASSLSSDAVVDESIDVISTSFELIRSFLFIQSILNFAGRCVDSSQGQSVPSIDQMDMGPHIPSQLISFPRYREVPEDEDTDGQQCAAYNHSDR